MQYRIFPPLGIARLGQDADFFLAPEIPSGGPGELQPDGTLTSVTRFKDASRTRIRKQAVRFHLFESSDGTTWSPAHLPATAVVTWSVTLVNKKSAVVRPAEPPITPTRPLLHPPLAGQIIDGGTKQVAGPHAASPVFHGVFTTGPAYRVEVELGQLRTDGQGRLLVLGGQGFSSAPPGTPLGGGGGTTYYKNPHWHDDVADGPVTASIQLTPDTPPIMAEGGAWVLVGPPDYAPHIGGIVTLYDVLLQVGMGEFGFPVPGIPSYDLDIAPLLTRARRLRWVHDDATWSSPQFDDPHLRSTAAAHTPLRRAVRDLVLSAETILAGHTNAAGPQFRLRTVQKTMLDAWVNGHFDDTPATHSLAPTAAGLTRAALESAVGQGFCPGIEAGILVLDTTIYRTPFDFRLDHAQVQAGDLTALMAQPWQADFLKCHSEWWPSQRPDLAPQRTGASQDWIRGARSHRLLVERAGRLGIIAQQGADEIFLEVERDPTL